MGAAEKKAPNGKRTTDVRALLVRSLDDRWRKYCKELKRCQKKYSEDSVHDLRVSTRRLISTLNILRSFIPGDRLNECRRALKQRLDMFDPLRDTQVQLLHVEEMLSTFPELQAFHDALVEQEQQVVKKISKKIHRLKTGKLEDSIAAAKKQLRALLKNPARQNDAQGVMTGAVDAAFAEVTDRRRNIDPRDSATIHRMRVAFKKFRYMMEVLQPIFPEGTAEQLKQMHAFQTMMGDVQDIEVLSASLKAFSEKKGKAQKRSLLPVQQELARRRFASIDAFLKSADDVFSFWEHDQFPVTSKQLSKKATV